MPGDCSDAVLRNATLGSSYHLPDELLSERLKAVLERKDSVDHADAFLADHPKSQDELQHLDPEASAQGGAETAGASADSAGRPGLWIVAGLIGWLNHHYLQTQLRPFVTISSYIQAGSAQCTRRRGGAVLKPGDFFRERAKDCPEMVVVPAGEFMMDLAPQ